MGKITDALKKAAAQRLNKIEKLDQRGEVKIRIYRQEEGGLRR